jgi:ketosteroid isomerase-like protein
MKAGILLSVILICSAPAKADVEDDVRCREIAFSQSVDMQDVTTFKSFIDADARFVGSSVQRGTEDIATAWAVFFSDDAPKMKWRPQFVEVLHDGTLALSRGPYRMIVEGEDGALTEYWGTFNSVWRKQDDGAWKVVFDAGNEAAGAPTEDVQALLDQDVDCP